ncbi:MAG: signal transduction protein [Symploca sp. SIO2D2]|nr:signal transduction protein [Symploca sp. SIO2D2]
MSYFAVMLARKQPEKLGLTAQVDWLPILLRIRDLARVPDMGILEFIEQFAQKNLSVATLPTGFFEHWLKEGKALILLDALDEVANPAKREEIVDKIRCFLGEFQQNRAIITSRPAGYRRDFFHTTEFPHYWLQKFDQERIQLFIEQWYNSRIRDPKEAQRCKDSLKEALEEQERIQLLAQNPLLLTIIALIHRYEAYLPRKRYKLYDRAVKTLLTNWEKRKDVDEHWQLEYLTRDDLERLMQRLAYWIHCQGDTGDKEGGTLIDRDELISQLSKFIAEQKRLERYQAKEEAKRFLLLVQNRAGLLNEQGQDYYAFVHKTFQEYLAAEEIRYRQEDDDFRIVLEHIEQYLHNAHWREVLLLLIAQQKPKKATRVLTKILGRKTDYEAWLHRNLFFAGSCLAEDIEVVDEDLVKEILQCLVELEISEDELVGRNIRNQVKQTLCSLSESRFEKQALELVKSAGDEVEEERLWKYQTVLGEKEAVIETLLGLLADDNSGVRKSAVNALGKWGNDFEKVHQALPVLIKDEDKKVRFSAALVLGLLGKNSVEVHQVLLALLTDEEQLVRIIGTIGVRILGKDSEEVHQALLALLTDEEQLVRIRAAEALGDLGKDLEEVHQALLALLTDEVQLLRICAVEALGNLGKDSEEVHQALLALLTDEEQRVRAKAAEALGNLGKDSEEVHQALLKLLKDENKQVRVEAARALGDLGKNSEEAHKTLLMLLTDEDKQVRIWAAKALGNLGKKSSEITPTVIQWIKQYQDSEYVGREIDLLWDLVVQDEG